MIDKVIIKKENLDLVLDFNNCLYKSDSFRFLKIDLPLHDKICSFLYQKFDNYNLFFLNLWEFVHKDLLSKTTTKDEEEDDILLELITIVNGDFSYTVTTVDHKYLYSEYLKLKNEVVFNIDDLTGSVTTMKSTILDSMLSFGNKETAELFLSEEDNSKIRTDLINLPRVFNNSEIAQIWLEKIIFVDIYLLQDKPFDKIADYFCKFSTEENNYILQSVFNEFISELDFNVSKFCFTSSFSNVVAGILDKSSFNISIDSVGSGVKVLVIILYGYFLSTVGYNVCMLNTNAGIWPPTYKQLVEILLTKKMKGTLIFMNADYGKY